MISNVQRFLLILFSLKVRMECKHCNKSLSIIEVVFSLAFSI